MSIVEQIDAVVKQVILPKPILKLKKGYWDGITIELNNTALVPDTAADDLKDVGDIVLQRTLQKIRLQLDIDKNKYGVYLNYRDILDGIHSDVIDITMDFLGCNGGYSNNKLSAIYRWYKQKLTLTALKKYDRLAKDIFNAACFIKTAKKGEEIETARTILNLIKNRYEPILGSI